MPAAEHSAFAWQLLSMSNPEEGCVEALEYRVDNFIVLELRGRVDEFNTGVLRDEIHTIINTGRFCIAIDLSKTEFLSAHCLGAIWNCQKRARRVGGDLVLVGPLGSVEETLAYVGIGAVLRVYPSLDSAREHFSQQAKHPIPASGGWVGVLRRFLQFFLCLCIWAQDIDPSWGAPAADLGLQGMDGEVEGEPRAGSGEPVSDTRLPFIYTLDELLDLARERSSPAQLAELQRQEKLQDMEVARSLNLPKLLLTSGYLYQSNPNLLNQLANRELNQLRQSGSESELSNLKTSSNVSIEKDVVVISAGLLQALYTGGLYEAQLELAEARSNEQQAAAELSMLEVEEAVRKLYWGIVLAEQKVRVVDAQRAASQARLEALQKAGARQMVGVAAVAKAEVDLLQAQRDQLATNQDLLGLRENLNRLLGLPLEEQIGLYRHGVEIVEELKEPLEYLQIAEPRSPKIRVASARVKTARAYDRAVQSSAVRSPKAFLLGSVDHMRGVEQDANLLNWTLGLAVTIPLLDGGKSAAELEKSRLLIDQARVAFDDARRELYLGIREAVSRLKEARLAMDIADQSAKIVAAQKEAAHEAAQRQQIPVFQMKEADISELKARIARLLAESDYMAWKSRLQVLVGEESL
jgi:outer membrane protein